MEVKFDVHGLPPKKDGANSMWRKGTELPRLKALRVAALEALGGAPMLTQNAELLISIYADSRSGDIDNFISGICDGLMKAHPNTPIDDRAWLDVPPEAHPRKSIAFSDDPIVRKIVAERKPQDRADAWYEIAISGE